MSDKKWNAIGYTSLSTIVGVVLFLGGYMLVVSEGHEAYGVAMFFMVPTVVGFAIGAVGRRGLYVIAAVALSIILSLGFLIVIGFEGWICCLMALPLIVLPMAVGAVIGYFVFGRRLDRKYDAARATVVLLIVCPFLMAAAGEAEKPWRNVQRTETISSEILLPTSPEKTWDLLVRMPRMDGEQPFLLEIGLPVPYRCTLDKDAVGGRRTCYFDQGRIEMEITEWRPPSTVAMKITNSTLPGRRWLSFIDAGYQLRPAGDGTRVIRHSKIGSRLYPRWYWRPFEAWGVVSEHEFVLSSLAKSATE